MVKQFTIPCQFGNETAPVTLYIGHPENTHHPIQFQSNWLSSVKGGTIPQDLMDTLQKLHDLANENGADFEELCYYALISATQGGNATKENINKFANEFIEKEGAVAQEEKQENNKTDAESDLLGGAETKTQAQQQEEKEDIEALSNIEDGEAKKEKIAPTLNAGEQSNNGKNNDDKTAASGSGDQDLLEDDILNPGSNDVNLSNSSSSQNTNNADGLVETFSQEDEESLLEDEMYSF